MAWRVEKWFRDVFPGKENIVSEYRSLTGRELAVVSASVLDLALAELITMRLVNIPDEYESFLGLNEDGRAPCATFGARIQLALLISIITVSDAGILRCIKNIRNKFAHRVRASFTSPEVLPLLITLHDRLVEHQDKMIAQLGGDQVIARLELDEIRQMMPKYDEAGNALLLVTFSVYHAYFHRLHSMTVREDAFKLAR